ncbi:MAG: response regulator [Chitinophagaceae bacterium]
MEYTKDSADLDEDPPPGEPLKVMLADDDKDDQETFGEALRESEIAAELTTVDNGQELLATLKDPSEPNPDIIFLDINMPVKNGNEVLAEIKKDADLKQIPTVMLSTSENVKDVEASFNAGANLYVRKPYSFQNFILLLKKIFILKWAGVLLNPLRKTFLLSERNISSGKDES